MTEAQLLEALRESLEVPPESDPGWTIVEIAEMLYGKATAGNRDKVGKALHPLIRVGTVKRGFRRLERVDGKMMQVAVFRA